jgi:hypothetical protein
MMAAWFYSEFFFFFTFFMGEANALDGYFIWIVGK